MRDALGNYRYPNTIAIKDKETHPLASELSVGQCWRSSIVYFKAWMVDVLTWRLPDKEANTAWTLLSDHSEVDWLPTDAISPDRTLCTELAERVPRLVSIRRQLLH
jgi:hypothetical protein